VFSLGTDIEAAPAVQVARQGIDAILGAAYFIFGAGLTAAGLAHTVDAEFTRTALEPALPAVARIGPEIGTGINAAGFIFRAGGIA